MSTASFHADAEVLKGGNRRYEVRVPVEIRDRRGNVWWEGQAVAVVDLPAGSKAPHVEVPPGTIPSVREVPRAG